MSTETKKARAKVAALSASLDKLEAELNPLFEKPLADTLAGLGPIEQARLQTLLPYVIYDLSFIQLKTHGVDPKSHPVIPELDRVRQYFEKIKKAEDTAPRPNTVDKDAAARFIKHAINSVQYKKSDPPQDSATTSNNAAPVPVRVTEKMLEREKYLREMQERDDAESSEGEELQIIGDDDSMKVGQPPVNDRKGKGKARALPVNADQAAVQASRKRRQKSNPFGNDNGQPPALSMDVDGLEEISPPALHNPGADARKSKKKRRKSAPTDIDGDSSNVPSTGDPPQKKKKKKKE